MQSRLQESTGHRKTESQETASEKHEHSLVSKTRPGYKSFSRSLSVEILSTVFSPTGVAVA
jgi:hypothetical protein